jgi:hypothetical protein
MSERRTRAAAMAAVDVDTSDPAVPVITVTVANASHGAAFPGDTVTLAAELARALIREGLATEVPPAPAPETEAGGR